MPALQCICAGRSRPFPPSNSGLGFSVPMQTPYDCRRLHIPIAAPQACCRQVVIELQRSDPLHCVRIQEPLPACLGGHRLDLIVNRSKSRFGRPTTVRGTLRLSEMHCQLQPFLHRGCDQLNIERRRVMHILPQTITEFTKSNRVYDLGS